MKTFNDSLIADLIGNSLPHNMRLIHCKGRPKSSRTTRRDSFTARDDQNHTVLLAPRSDQEGAISTHLYTSLPLLFIYRSAPLSRPVIGLNICMYMSIHIYTSTSIYLSICLASYLTLYVYVYGESASTR